MDIVPLQWTLESSRKEQLGLCCVTSYCLPVEPQTQSVAVLITVKTITC